MMVTHPETTETYYFVDKCLPFSTLISCAIYQAISDAIAYLVAYRTKKPNVNYLDDYLFVAAPKLACYFQVRTLLEICEKMFPSNFRENILGNNIIRWFKFTLNHLIES